MAAKKKPAGKAAAKIQKAKAQQWTRNRGKQPVDDGVYIIGRRRDKQETVPLQPKATRSQTTSTTGQPVAGQTTAPDAPIDIDLRAVEILPEHAQAIAGAVHAATGRVCNVIMEMPHPSAAPSPLWIVGRFHDGTWDFQGLFATEQEAVALCDDADWFVAPAVLGEHIPIDTIKWPGCYSTKAEPIPHEAKALAAGLDVKPEKVAEDLAAAEPRSITGLSPLHVVLPPVPAPAAAPSEPEPELPHEDDDIFTRGQIISASVVCSLIVVGLLMYLRHTLPAVVAP